ncbi:YbaB/EbfC family nucleoid-associated protein [Nonomuraea typhae]|uniref:YbaB/EbfC family nucleoid-associated protein n=1 Tax=Nonomuraea typhae TaxID=2603600 RepID=UPI0012F94851|nr:YbaB/EbfC family nucleoid-associated protein [Nonomuraea typhae]
MTPEHDAAGLHIYVEELRDGFLRLHGEAGELHARAQAVQVTEQSRDGLVTVTVDARGELVGLEIDPRVYRDPDARALADTIAGTLARATEKAREQIVDVFAHLIPAEQLRAYLDGDLEAVLTQLAEQMGGNR